eukprot:994585-Amphidinium_carterae.2
MLGGPSPMEFGYSELVSSSLQRGPQTWKGGKGKGNKVDKGGGKGKKDGRKHPQTSRTNNS